MVLMPLIRTLFAALCLSVVAAAFAADPNDDRAQVLVAFLHLVDSLDERGQVVVRLLGEDHDDGRSVLVNP